MRADDAIDFDRTTKKVRQLTMVPLVLVCLCCEKETTRYVVVGRSDGRRLHSVGFTI